MEGPQVLAGWDTILLAVPFAALLMMVMFGLDERLAGHRARRRERKTFCQVEVEGEMKLTDPDGRPWQQGSNPIFAPSAAPARRRWYVLDEEHPEGSR